MFLKIAKSGNVDIVQSRIRKYITKYIYNYSIYSEERFRQSRQLYNVNW